MKINAEIIKEFNPCKGTFNQGIKDYPKWEGTFLQFLKLKKIKPEDKIWVFSKLPYPDKLKREFAIWCAEQACEYVLENEQLCYLNILEILRQYNNGEQPEEIRDAAWYAAWYAAGGAAGHAARDAAWYVARGAAWYAARHAARDAARYAAGDAAEDAAREAQLKQLIKMIEKWERK
jgi:hypothetical protein